MKELIKLTIVTNSVAFFMIALTYWMRYELPEYSDTLESIIGMATLVFMISFIIQNITIGLWIDYVQEKKGELQ